MQYREPRLECSNQQRAVLVAKMVVDVSSNFIASSKGGGANTNPIAKVLQSAAGAMAETAIWSIVLDEMCSDVVGSKRITFPWALPGTTISSVVSQGPRTQALTECDISVSHPSSAGEVIVRSKPGDLISRDDVPDNGCLSGVVADHQSSRPYLAEVVHCEKQYLIRVAGESSLYCQSVVVGADD